MTPEEEIERLYRTHGHSVLRRARHILGDEHEANEVLQELFMSLLDRPGQFRGESSVTTWLYSVTTHLCLNRLRSQRTRLRLVEERVAPAQPDEAPARADQRALAQQLLAGLPGEVAEAAVYYYCDEMSQEEIAGVLGCSRRHVGDLLERCRERARAWEAAP